MKPLITVTLLCSCLFFSLNGCKSGGTQNPESVEAGDRQLLASPNKKKKEAKFNAYLGQPLSELRAIYVDGDWREESAWKYGYDGGGNGFTWVENGEPQFFYFQHYEKEEVGGIAILNPAIEMPGGYHVGMTVEEVLKISPDASFGLSLLDENEEYIHPPGVKFSFYLLKENGNRAGRYKMEEGEYVLVEVVNPAARVDRIML